MSDFELQTPDFHKEQSAKSSLNLSALAVRERPVTVFFLLAVIVAGVFAYFKLGRAEDPNLTIKVFTVTAAWPGATAKEMQDLVADPLEPEVGMADAEVTGPRQGRGTIEAERFGVRGARHAGDATRRVERAIRPDFGERRTDLEEIRPRGGGCQEMQEVAFA